MICLIIWPTGLPYSGASHQLHLSRVQLQGHGARNGELDLPPLLPVRLSRHHVRVWGQQRVHLIQLLASAAKRTSVQPQTQEESVRGTSSGSKL